ncbi:MAG: hypothetical protein PHQ12_01745 [Chthoniobacteraceae bacterium]|nr:hypothetical protein [Chthoniobacteraceae bacterium]
MSAPHIVYFGQTPGQGTGSPIILLRHLRRLAAHGWKVSLVAESGQSTEVAETEGWPVFHLSLRKPWWPPFRPENRLSRAVRMRLWAAECGGFFPEPPRAVLTYLGLHSTLHSEAAARYARRCGAPLTVLVHDYPPAFPDFSPEDVPSVLRRQLAVLREARQVWFASPQLAARYPLPPERSGVLIPIPEGGGEAVRWSPTFAESPLIVYAGAVYPAQFPLFRALARAFHAAGARLLLLARRTPGLDALCAAEPVERRDLFPTNAQALAFLRAEAAAVLASYCERVEEMPWIATSFPSKFAEFTHLGLPLLLAAPAESAIGLWAAQNGYPDFLPAAEPRALAAFVEALKTEAAWNKKAAATAHFAQTAFDPDAIQAAFEAKL